MQVFDLGPAGADAPSKVAETTEFLADAARAMGGARLPACVCGGLESARGAAAVASVLRDLELA